METFADGLQTYKNIFQEALQEILKYLPKKYKDFRESLVRKQEEIAGEKDKRQANANKYFIIFKYCLEAHIPRLSQAVIHFTEKLIAYKYLDGNCYDYTQELPGLENTEKKAQSAIDPSRKLMETIIDSICDAVHLKDENVNLQIIRCLLTLATSTNCSVQGDSLEKIMRTIIGIHCSSKQPQIQDPSKHAFTQIIVETFKKMEKNTLISHEEAQIFQNKRQIGSKISSSQNLQEFGSIVDEQQQQELISSYMKKTMTNIIDDVCIYDDKVKKITRKYLNQPQSEQQKQAEIDLIPRKSVPNIADVDTPQYKKTTVASIHNEIDIPAGKFGWCIICRNEASNFCKDMRVPVCSKECKAKHMEEVSTLSRFCNRSHEAVVNQFVLDALTVFKFLCKVSKEDPANNLTGSQLRQKVIILELLLTVLETAGPVFLSKKEFTQAIQDNLVPSLLENSLSTEKAVFSLSFGIVGNLVSNFRENLKTEVAVFMENILLRILESTNSNFSHRIYCLRVFRKIFTLPRAVIELFVNYDCFMNQTCILEHLVVLLAKISQGKYLKQEYINLITPEQATELSALTISSVSELMKGLSTFVFECDKLEEKQHTTYDQSQSMEDANLENEQSLLSKSATQDEQTKDPIEQERQKKQQFLLGIQKFGMKAKVGIRHLIQAGIIQEGNPKDLAELFYQYNAQFSHEKIGEIFGSPDEFSKRVLAEFSELLTFQDLDLVNALRLFLTYFQLPGEGEQVDRILEKFGEKYSLDNPNCYKSATTSYTLSYALMMLHTSTHSAQVQEKERMTLPQFIKLIKGIDDGSDLPEEMSQQLYADIKKNPLGIHHLEASKKALEDAMNSNQNKKHELFLKETEQMFEKGKLKIENYRDDKYIQVFSKDYIMPLLQVLWSPVFASLSKAMMDTEDLNLVSDILEGFKSSINLLGQFHMITERETFVFELCRLTGLLTPMKLIKQKNVLAIKAILDLSLHSPNILGKSWKILLECVSKLDNYYLIAQNLRRDIDLISSDAYLNQTQDQNNSLGQEELDKYNSQVIMKYVDQAEIDKIFHHSNVFDGETIVEFIRCLCELSREEIESISNPRIFCIQRIGEVTEFNMSRVRIIWNKIWEILKSHYNLIGCHQNSRVSALAIDSLKQLAVKFLEKPELSHYQFQKDFLSPFEYIFQKHPLQSFDTKELILSCLSMMTVSRAQHIRSGWKTILRVVNLTLQEENPRLVELAVSISDVIMSQPNLDNLLDVFGDLIHALTNQTKYKSEFVAQKALDHLKKCIVYLVHNTLRQSEVQQSQQQPNPANTEDKQVQDSQKSPKQKDNQKSTEIQAANVNNSPQQQQDLRQSQHQQQQNNPLSVSSVISRKESLIVNESKKLLEGYLIPILSNFSSFFSDDRPRIITKSVGYLFDSIKQYSYTFNFEFWNLIFKGVLRPLFDDMQFAFQRSEFISQEVYKASKNASIKAFSDFVALFVQQFDILHSCLPDFLSIMHNTIATNQETLSTISLNSLQSFLNSTGSLLKEEEWDTIIASLEELSKTCQPTDILEAKNASEDFDKPLSTLLKEQLDYRKYPVKMDFQKNIIQCVIFKNMIAFISDLFSQFSQLLTEKQIDNLKSMLQYHLQFAEDFNSRIYLRFYLWKNGLNSGLQTLPVLGRQEKLARTGILAITYERYNKSKTKTTLEDFLNCSEGYMKNLQELLIEFSKISADKLQQAATPKSEQNGKTLHRKSESGMVVHTESQAIDGQKQNNNHGSETNLNEILKSLALEDKSRQLKLLRFIIGDSILPQILNIDCNEIADRIHPLTNLLIDISNQELHFDDQFNSNMRAILKKFFEFAFSKK